MEHRRTQPVTETRSEKVFEQALTKAGIKYEKHFITRGYEIDYLLEGKIAIEIDGFYHLQRSVAEKDNRKDRYLQEQGYLVLRFTNDQVRQDIKGCIEEVQAAMKIVRKYERLRQDNQMRTQPSKLLRGHLSTVRESVTMSTGPERNEPDETLPSAGLQTKTRLSSHRKTPALNLEPPRRMVPESPSSPPDMTVETPDPDEPQWKKVLRAWKEKK